MANDQKFERVAVLLPSELIERIDAYRGAPHDLVATVAKADRKPGRVIVSLPQETIELLDAFRAALGLKTRAEAIIRLIEDGLRAKLS